MLYAYKLYMLISYMLFMGICFTTTLENSLDYSVKHIQITMINSKKAISFLCAFPQNGCT